MKRGHRLWLAGVAALLVLTPIVTVAQETDGGLIVECDRANITDGAVTGVNRCGIEQFVEQFVRLAQYGITIVVFLAALMLVYGGFEFITAGGRQSKISSGQNIITGTVIGLIVSFSAYIIINFAVGAITGTQTSTNPFTAIATVFGRPEQKSAGLTRPFSGEGEISSATCRSDWDNSCIDQVLCADAPEDGLTGQIAVTQARLNTLGCGCGNVDGCFGAQTLTCVRRFQIANSLVPTGTLDQETSDALNEASPLRCDSATANTQITSTLNALPKPTASVSGVTTGNSGCCVVNKNVSGDALTPMYCVDEMDQRACAALGADYYFVNGKRCSEDSETIKMCGFCRSSSGSCFQQTGKYWCEQVAKESNNTTPLTYNQGLCTGLTTLCGGGCDSTLKTRP